MVLDCAISGEITDQVGFGHTSSTVNEHVFLDLRMFFSKRQLGKTSMVDWLSNKIHSGGRRPP